MFDTLKSVRTALQRHAIALTMLVSNSSFAALDVNKASQAELESIAGLGPTMASLIVDERRNGPFKGWGDLVGRVKGIGERSAARLSAEGLTVNGASFQRPAANPDARSARSATAGTRVPPGAAASATDR